MGVDHSLSLSQGNNTQPQRHDCSPRTSQHQRPDSFSRDGGHTAPKAVHNPQTSSQRQYTEDSHARSWSPMDLQISAPSRLPQTAEAQSGEKDLPKPLYSLHMGVFRNFLVANIAVEDPYLHILKASSKGDCNATIPLFVKKQLFACCELSWVQFVNLTQYVNTRRVSPFHRPIVGPQDVPEKILFKLRMNELCDYMEYQISEVSKASEISNFSLVIEKPVSSDKLKPAITFCPGFRFIFVWQGYTALTHALQPRKQQDLSIIE